MRAIAVQESDDLTYTPAVRLAGGEVLTTNQPEHNAEHPTQELPTLDFAPPRKSLGSRLLNSAVTALLAIAVLGILVVNVGPLVLPYKVFTVLSGSMDPTIPMGSEVVLRPVGADQIQVGDIITFQRPGTKELVTHRVVGTTTAFGGQTFWKTKGDANGAPDTWQIPASGTGLKYVFHVPFLGYAFAMLGSPLGRICFILAPALLLAAVVLNDLWKQPQPAQATPTAGPRRQAGR